VVSLVAPTLDALAAAVDGGAAGHGDLVELRLDHVAGAVVADPGALAALVARAGKPVIAALHGGEGFGAFDGDVGTRRAALHAAADAGAAYVDVDERFAAEVGELGVPRILSTHREARTVEELDALARRLDDLRVPGRDLVKLVPPAGEASFGLEVLTWLAARPAGGTVAFCSGEPGSFTRLLAPAYGSALTYAAPEPVAGVPLETAAPGQLRASHVRAVWPGRAPARTTQIAAVCGDPIGHSAGPVVHGAALRAVGLDGVLVPFGATPLAPLERLQAPGAPEHAPPLAGLSVTAPFKQAPLGLVGSGALEASGDALAMGAVNTVARAGGWVASNTDAPAVRAALEEAGARLDGADALVIGAGGAARAAVHALAGAGARVTVAARRLEAAAALGADGAVALSDPALGELRPDVLVHTTPLGTDGVGEAPIPDEHLRPGVFVLDAVYRPRRTSLLQRAAERGAAPVEGASWFLHQAWLQHLLIFAAPYGRAFGADGPPPELARAAMAAMGEALAAWLDPGAEGDGGRS
jgi:shikimate dehydrogenase